MTFKILLRMAFVVLMCAVSAVAANAENGGPELKALISAPENGVDFYRKLESANQLFEKKEWADAETILKELSGAYPWNGTIWGRLAIAYRQQKKHAEAIQAYKKVMQIQGPGIPFRARYWIAASYAALGNKEAALKTLEQLVNSDAYLEKPRLIEDENFVSLKNDPQLEKIAGKEDVSKLNRNEGWRKDIDVLAAEVKRNNFDGAPVPEEFFRRQRELKASLPKLADLEVVAGIGHMLNALQRGHTALWLGEHPGKFEFKPFPIHLYIFPEGVFIIEALPGFEDLPGAQVLQFDNTPAEEALKKIASIQSNESPMEMVWVSPYLLTIPEVLKGLGIIQQSDRAEFKLKMRDGSVVSKTLEIIKTPPTAPRLKLAAPPKVQAPLFLKNINEMHWLEALPEHHAIYVQVNNIMADPDETMAQFGLRLRKTIGESNPQNIILDIRHNNGGDTFTYQELLRTLTAFSTMEGKKVYVLIGRNVYSAAANLTADLERMVRPIFVGESTSASGNQWGDESYFVLPYSGLSGAVPGTRWQLSHPWDERRFIVPQVPVQLTADAYFKGEDPALDVVFKLMDRALVTSRTD